jgi:hypothetical protein
MANTGPPDASGSLFCLRAAARRSVDLWRSPRPEAPTHWRRVPGLGGVAAGTAGGIPMRLILGIILGAALTVGGAYISDTAAGAGAKPMVNWDVVAKNFDDVSAVTRAGWKKITG